MTLIVATLGRLSQRLAGLSPIPSSYARRTAAPAASAGGRHLEIGTWRSAGDGA